MADRRLPVRAAPGHRADGQRGLPGDRDRDRQAGRAAGARRGGDLDQVRRSGAAARRDRRARRRGRDRPAAGDLRRAGQGGADRAADRGDPGGRGDDRRPALAPADDPLPQGGDRRWRGFRGDPRYHSLRRARLQPGRAAQPQALYLRAGRPGDRRGLRDLHGGAAPDADRGGRGAGRIRRRIGPDHRGGARRQGADGYRDRRRGRGPAGIPRRVRWSLRARDRRRRDDAQRRHRQGAGAGRRRGHGRLPVRPGGRGPGARLPLGRRGASPGAAARRPAPGGNGRHAHADPARPVHRRGRLDEPRGRAAPHDGDVGLLRPEGVPARRGRGHPRRRSRPLSVPAPAAGRARPGRWACPPRPLGVPAPATARPGGRARPRGPRAPPGRRRAGEHGSPAPGRADAAGPGQAGAGRRAPPGLRVGDNGGMGEANAVRPAARRRPARTRGGWEPAGTAAARRTAHGERVTAKGLRTREELVAAARRVFERDGYSAARVADIAAEAGVAHGSFYTYFSSKQDVFLAVMRSVGDQFTAAVTPPPAAERADPYQALDRANRRFLDAYRANSAIWALAEQVATIDPRIHRIRLQGRREHVDRVAKAIRRWQDRGLADPDVDPETTAGALVSMISNFAYWWLAGGDSYEPEAAAATLTRIWARAVGLRCPDAGGTRPR